MFGIRTRFRHLLIGLVLAAVVLLILRYALRSESLAVGLAATGIAAVVIVLAVAVICTLLRLAGRLFDSPTAAPARPKEAKKPEGPPQGSTTPVPSEEKR